MSIELHYWKIRGLAEQLVTLCEHLNVPYTLVKHELKETWMTEKQELMNQGFLAANLPYIKDGETFISETTALALYIVQKSGKAEYFPQSPQFIQLMGVVGDVKSTFTGPCYSAQTTEELKTKLQGSVDSWIKTKLVFLNDVLSNNQWLMGAQLTYVDFFFAELLEMIFAIETEVGVTVSATYPNFKAYVERFVQLAGVKEYRASEKFVARPFNNYMAIWK